MKHFQITVVEVPNQCIKRLNYRETYEIAAPNAVAAKQEALDRFGDFSRISDCVEFDPDYPPRGGKTEAGPSLDSRIAHELSLHPGHRHCNTCPFDVGDTHERDCSYPDCSGLYSDLGMSLRDYLSEAAWNAHENEMTNWY